MQQTTYPDYEHLANTHCVCNGRLPPRIEAIALVTSSICVYLLLMSPRSPTAVTTMVGATDCNHSVEAAASMLLMNRVPGRLQRRGILSRVGAPTPPRPHLSMRTCTPWQSTLGRSPSTAGIQSASGESSRRG